MLSYVSEKFVGGWMREGRSSNGKMTLYLSKCRWGMYCDWCQMDVECVRGVITIV